MLAEATGRLIITGRDQGKNAMNILKWSGMVAMFALVAIASGAENERTLKIGDPAPKLRVSQWVQGDPVVEFARDKAYIVEFWAT